MKKVFNILTLIFFLIVVLGVMMYLKVETYSNDDWWTCFFCGDFFNTFLSSDQGLVWSWFTMKILSHTIPNILQIHPQQNVFVALMKGLNFACSIYILSTFFDIIKKNVPNILVVIINTIIIFSIEFLVDPASLFLINPHMKYFLNLNLGLLVWIVWYRDFFNNEFLIKKHLIRDCFFVIILAFCGHLVNIPSIVMFLGIFIYGIFSSENRKNKFYQSIKQYLPLSFLYMIGLWIYLHLPGFTIIRAERLPQDSVLHYMITNFTDFSRDFIFYIFSTKYISGMFIAALLGFLIMFIYRKKIDIKYFVLSTSIFVGILAFEYALLACGRTFYDHKSYWFLSYEITMTFLFYLVIVLNIVYGCLYKLIDSKIAKMCFILIIVGAISFIYPIKNVIKEAKIGHKKMLVQRDAIYKMNKICRYYDLTNNTIYIPYHIFKNINLFGDLTDYYWENVTRNLSLIYNIPQEKRYEKVYSNLANENELFDTEELQNIDFYKLYDDEFIIQMKEPIFKK